jgi:hypothetical protein
MHAYHKPWGESMHTVVAYQQCIRSPHYSAQISAYTLYICVLMYISYHKQNSSLWIPPEDTSGQHICAVPALHTRAGRTRKQKEREKTELRYLELEQCWNTGYLLAIMAYVFPRPLLMSKKINYASSSWCKKRRDDLKLHAWRSMTLPAS